MPEEEKAIECPETEPVETADEASAPEEQDDPARTEGEVAEETEETEETEKTEETEEQPCVRPEKKKRKKRLKFYEITPENDIRYRGPLSYRYLPTQRMPLPHIFASLPSALKMRMEKSAILLDRKSVV